MYPSIQLLYANKKILWKKKETHLPVKDTQRQKQRMESNIPNKTPKQARVTIFINDKEDFKPKLIRRNKDYHYILTKGRIHQEDVMTVNIHAPRFGEPNFIIQTLLDIKKQIN
jgi:tRNA U38,U39,U40 pseudouridine synthase TruA